MIERTPEAIGRHVIYQAAHDFGGGKREGVIVSWNYCFVFVRYGGDIGVKAQFAEDLEWAEAAA